MRLGAEVQGDVLLGDEARADARAQVLVEEACDLGGGDVAAALEEALGEDGNGVCVGLDELGEDFGEADLVLEGGEGVLGRSGARGVAVVEPGEEGGERVLVVVVDLGDVTVGDDDIWQIS